MLERGQKKPPPPAPALPQTLLRVADPRPLFRVRRRRLLPAVGDTGAEDVLFAREVAVDGQPLHACALGDGTDRRARGSAAHVQFDGSLDDPATRLGGCLGPLLLAVSPRHETVVFIELDRVPLRNL